MARTLEWHAANGDVIHFCESPPYMLETFYPGVPSGAAETARGVRTDGQATYHVSAEPLTPSATGAVIAEGGSYGETQTKLDALRMRLQAALNPKHFGTLIYNGYAGSFKLRCRPITGAQFDKRFGNTHKIDVEWISDDPYWTAKNPMTLSVGLIRKLWRFPWHIKPTAFGSILNRGIISNPTNIDIYPVITISDTESSKITVGNASIGEAVTVAHSIERGEKLVLDMAEPSAKLIGLGGEETDVTHWTTVDSAFPWRIVPGGNDVYSAVDNPELSPIIMITWYLPEGGL